jgi:hypothetical protein
MTMLDIFRSDAFSVVSLTDAILKAAHKPGRIGSSASSASAGSRRPRWSSRRRTAASR